MNFVVKGIKGKLMKNVSSCIYVEECFAILGFWFFISLLIFFSVASCVNWRAICHQPQDVHLYIRWSPAPCYGQSPSWLCLQVLRPCRLLVTESRHQTIIQWQWHRRRSASDRRRCRGSWGQLSCVSAQKRASLLGWRRVDSDAAACSELDECKVETRDKDWSWISLS